MPKQAIRKICILMFLFLFLFSFALPASAITEDEVQKQVDTQSREAVTGQGGNPLTRMAFNSFWAQGGNFANGIIGTVAQGNIARTGSITGQPAADAASSYMGWLSRRFGLTAGPHRKFS